MNRGAPTLVLAALLAGCGFECRTGWLEPEPIALGIEADLHAVIALGDAYDANGILRSSYLAVGPEGTVVAWWLPAYYYDEEPTVERFDLGLADFDLYGVAVREGNWWIVGEGGTAIVSGDLGRNWTHVDVGTTADLRGITDAGLGLVVVGEGVISVQAPDGTWTAVPAPVAAGWGSLRDVHWDGTRVHAVGLGGVIWSAEDPREDWEAVDLGIDADLHAIGPLTVEETREVAVVGTDGTFLTHDPDSGWSTRDLGIDVDLIDYAQGTMLSGDGTVYWARPGRAPTIVGQVVGARSLDLDFDEDLYAYSSTHEMMIVGDGGLASALDLDGCLYP